MYPGQQVWTAEGDIREELERVDGTLLRQVTRTAERRRMLSALTYGHPPQKPVQVVEIRLLSELFCEISKTPINRLSTFCLKPLGFQKLLLFGDHHEGTFHQHCRKLAGSGEHQIPIVDAEIRKVKPIEELRLNLPGQRERLRVIIVRAGAVVIERIHPVGQSVVVNADQNI